VGIKACCNRTPTPEERLKIFIEDRGCTQADVADYLKIAHSNISMYLNGLRKLPRNTLLLVKYFNTCVSMFIYKGEKK
jgi:transcriptional regulator